MCIPKRDQEWFILCSSAIPSLHCKPVTHQLFFILPVFLCKVMGQKLQCEMAVIFMGKNNLQMVGGSLTMWTAWRKSMWIWTDMWIVACSEEGDCQVGLQMLDKWKAGVHIYKRTAFFKMASGLHWCNLKCKACGWGIRHSLKLSQRCFCVLSLNLVSSLSVQRGLESSMTGYSLWCISQTMSAK